MSVFAQIQERINRARSNFASGANPKTKLTMMDGEFSATVPGHLKLDADAIAEALRVSLLKKDGTHKEVTVKKSSDEIGINKGQHSVSMTIDKLADTFRCGQEIEKEQWDAFQKSAPTATDNDEKDNDKAEKERIKAERKAERERMKAEKEAQQRIAAERNS